MKTLDEKTLRQINALKLLQREMTDEQRLNLWGQLMEDYCTHCGGKDPEGKCQCWNDE